MTSPYFTHYDSSDNSEVNLLEDIINESIYIQGHSCYYLPRENIDDIDLIFGENTQSKFENAYMMDMYILNTETFSGDGDFFSKFGLDIRNNCNFVIGRRTFAENIPSDILLRPREGDLIYVPLFNKIFEIKFVEQEANFYSIGKRTPYIYELRCEQFRFSNETIDTGVMVLDNLERSLAYTIELSLTGSSNNYIIGEIAYQGANLSYSTASGEVKEWNSIDKKVYIINTKGNFIANTSLVGNTSNSIYTVINKDDTTDFINYDLYDNNQIKLEGNNYIVITGNPFGEP